MRAGGRKGEGISNRRFGEGKEKEKETDKVKNHQLLRDGIQFDCALVSGDDTGEQSEKIEHRKAIEMTMLKKRGVGKERDDQVKWKVDRVVIEEEVSKMGMLFGGE